MSGGGDWYLREWMAHFGKKQAALINELGWERKRASHVWNSKQPYKRDDVNAVAAWLGVAAYELLMPPGEALANRAFRQAAIEIAGRSAQARTEAAPTAAASRSTKRG